LTLSRLLVTLTTTDEDRRYLRERLPEVAVRFLGAAKPSPDDLNWAEAVLGNVKPPACLTEYPRIRWLHSPNVGLEAYDSVRAQCRDLEITNTKGIVDDAVAEHALALLLAMTRSVPVLLSAQAQHRWDPADSEVFPRTTIAGKTAHVLGYGAIARNLIGKLEAFGMRVSVYRRRVHGNDDRVNRFLALSQLEHTIAEADVVFVLLPELKETAGLINGRILQAMRETAYLVNVGRGSTIDERALTTALERRSLRGAALDVFTSEPLPGASPLWHLPNALISPHVASRFDRLVRRQIESFVERWKQLE